MKKHTNKDFMVAITAACALVSAADGSIDSEEKQKMAGFVKRSEHLKMFNTTKVISSFNDFADETEFYFNIGKDAAMKAIRKVTDDEQKVLLVRVGCAIGASDGDFDDEEKEIMREVCDEIGVAPNKFGL
jgi:tellurite resistance protein TerB